MRVKKEDWEDSFASLGLGKRRGEEIEEKIECANRVFFSLRLSLLCMFLILS